MSKKQKNVGNDSPDVEFIACIEQLSELGIAQQEIANQLGITPGHISRVKKGERRATQQHLDNLKAFIKEILGNRRIKETGQKNSFSALSVFSIDHGVLGAFAARPAVEAFRDLLFAQTAALGLSVTSVNISSSIYVSDGGVDASISEHVHVHDDLLDAGTRFQIKTGDFFVWQKAVLQKELFGKKKSISFSNLGVGIQEALKKNERIVFVCFGVDPIDQQLREASRHLEELFAQVGYPKARVCVWGQSHLIGLYHKYPSLCLRLRGHKYDYIRTHLSWSQNDDMLYTLCDSPERMQLVNEVRQQLIGNRYSHIRLLGEPGVGKTRLALDITSDKLIAPLTLYVKEASKLLNNALINELIESDDNRFVVFVVDECSSTDRADLWNVLKSKSDRIRVISIDHGPDESVDSRMRLIQVEPVSNDVIIAILMSHGINENEAKRWSDFCEGCPRVAHVLGDNLKNNRIDLLQTPATVDVWRRFVIGADSADSEEVQLRKTVLRYISLFEKFGFEGPISTEAKFIASLACRCDQRLTWERFQSIVRNLKDRRILQGESTLYITPRLLHIHLYREFWEHHGVGFELNNSLSGMPDVLKRWFVNMLKYAHGLSAAEHAISQVLDDCISFPDGHFPDNPDKAKMIDVLSETNPKAVLQCLQRTVGEMDLGKLLALKKARQHIAWALEKIAVWKDCFLEAAGLLLKLAEAENSDVGNNSTATFLQLFSLHPGFAPTQAHPNDRIAVIKEALHSSHAKQRRLGIDACVTALTDSSGFRLIGPEHQGLRQTLDFWMPTTYEELWQCHRDIWDLLISMRKVWVTEERALLNSAIIKTAWSTLHTPTLTDDVIHTLEDIAGEDETDIGELSELLQRQIRHRSKRLTNESIAKLELLVKSLEGNDFSTRLKRFVKYVTWEDTYVVSEAERSRLNVIQDQLADEAISNIKLLQQELPWLINDTSSPAYSFAYRISTRDTKQSVLKLLLEYCDKSAIKETVFLAGYLSHVFNINQKQWEAIMLNLADCTPLTEKYSDLVIGSGMSDPVALKVIVLCRQKKQKIELLERWWCASQIKKLSQSTIAKLISLHLDQASGNMWSTAVHILHNYFFEKDHCAGLPESLAFQVLTAPAMSEDRAAHKAGYYWSKLAAAFIEQFPLRKWELFSKVIENGMHSWSLLEDLNTQEETVLTEILRHDPEQAFNCIADIFDEEKEFQYYGISNWLSHGGHHVIGNEPTGPIQFIPSKILFDWVDKNVQQRSGWLAHILPKTLDDSMAGRLTRDFVAKYGNDRGASASLLAHFNSRSWCGKESDHCRALRDQARSWLVHEKSPVVKRWVNRYIDGLSNSIDRAKIDEERRL